MHTLVLSFPIAFACSRLACSITSVPGFWWTLGTFFLDFSGVRYGLPLWLAFLPSSGVLFLKSTLLLGYIAKLQSPHSHVANSTLLLGYLAILQNCQVHFQNELQAAHKSKKILGCPRHEFSFLVCWNFCPQKTRQPMIFFKNISTGCLHPLYFPSLFSLLIFVELMTLWSLIGALSNFKLPSILFFEHIESKFVLI